MLQSPRVPPLAQLSQRGGDQLLIRAVFLCRTQGRKNAATNESTRQPTRALYTRVKVSRLREDCLLVSARLTADVAFPTLPLLLPRSSAFMVPSKELSRPDRIALGSIRDR